MTALTIQENQMFMLLGEAVIHDTRAPTANKFQLLGVKGVRRCLAGLIAKDYIEMRNYGHNWRVVFIKHGQHKGRHSKMPPNDWIEHDSSKQRRGVL